MTSIRSSLLLLVLLLAPVGCGEPEPAPATTPTPVAHPLVRALGDADPAVRRHAAEGLGRLEGAPREVVLALVEAQDDEDTSVAAAALEALERLQPDADVALRLYGPECYEVVEEQERIRHQHVSWRKVACEPDTPPEGERLGACWMLAVIPPVYETRSKQVLVRPGLGRWHDAERVRAGDVPMVHPTPPLPPLVTPEKALPPEGEPAGAQPGEVWCWYETGSGKQWRRHPECEIPAAAR